MGRPSLLDFRSAGLGYRDIIKRTQSSIAILCTATLSFRRPFVSALHFHSLICFYLTMDEDQKITNGTVLHNFFSVVKDEDEQHPIQGQDNEDSYFREHCLNCGDEFNNFQLMRHEEVGFNVYSANDQVDQQDIKIGELLNPPAHSLATSQTPSTEDYSGEMEFKIDMSDLASNRSWIYSENLNKLYIKRNIYFPINFRLNSTHLVGYYIRIVPIYPDPDSIEIPVRRCVKHRLLAGTNKDCTSEHIITTNCQNAFYLKDEFTQRRSICIKLEELQYETNKLKTLNIMLMCFNSCAYSSANIKPKDLILVFTLETMGTVIGRKTLNIRSCAAPKRDYENASMLHVNNQANKIKVEKTSEGKYNIWVPREFLSVLGDIKVVSNK